jgi:hypothetical protein
MGWLTGTYSLPIGGFILATFLALSNYLTPSGAREHARITAIPKGIGQGQVAVSGTLARTNVLGGATVFPAAISIPDGMNRDQLRLGMSGSATAFALNAKVIGLLASILVRMGSCTAYL